MLSHARFLFTGVLLASLFPLPIKAKISEMELRLNQPYKKWAKLEKRAAKLGLHTSLESYLAAHQYPKPRLFLDSDFGKSLVREQLDLEEKSKEFPISKSFILPDITCDHDIGIAVLRENLTDPLPEDSSAEEVYKALLNQCIPDHQKLDSFKKALLEANSLGFIYSRECPTFYPASPVSELANQLGLRAICSAGLGSNDYSDLEAIQKLITLNNCKNAALLGHSISICHQLHLQKLIGFFMRLPNVDREKFTKLFIQSQNVDNEVTLNTALKAEFMLQCEGMTAFINGNPYPESKFNEKKLSSIANNFTDLQKLAARQELAEFSLTSLFDLNTGKARVNNTSTRQPAHVLLKCYKGASSSRKVIKLFSEDLDFYLESTAEAEVLLDVFKIANACQLYFLEQANYPESIELLTPKYLLDFPTNDYSGSAYLYQLGSENSLGPIIKGFITLPEKGPVTHEIEL